MGVIFAREIPLSLSHAQDNEMPRTMKHDASNMKLIYKYTTLL